MKINLIEAALNFLYPPKCSICNKLDKNYICNSCYKGLKVQERNELNKVQNKEFNEHFWLFEYKNVIREKIIDYKFNDKSYVYRMFVELILKNDEALNYIKLYDIIVPVPIHKKRLKQRGYNQSELIAKDICKQLRLDCKANIIKKVKNIIAQSTLNKEQRLENVKGAYKLNINSDDLPYLEGKKILLIDDVYTTGSTLNECAKVLKCINDVSVGALTIAKDL